jgi:hypothetical protein
VGVVLVGMHPHDRQRLADYLARKR